MHLRELLGGRLFALHPDGRRVALAPPAEGDAVLPTHLTLVLDPFGGRVQGAPASATR